MKKAISKEALAKEAAYWTEFRKAAAERPGKMCHK
jgi:hypothetical protein